jgi:hypothetical protein
MDPIAVIPVVAHTHAAAIDAGISMVADFSMRMRTPSNYRELTPFAGSPEDRGHRRAVEKGLI